MEMPLDSHRNREQKKRCKNIDTDLALRLRELDEQRCKKTRCSVEFICCKRILVKLRWEWIKRSLQWYQQKRKNQKNWYLKQRKNPEFRQRRREQERNRYNRLKQQDPAFIKRRRELQRERYQMQRQDPNFRQKKRDQERERYLRRRLFINSSKMDKCEPVVNCRTLRTRSQQQSSKSEETTAQPKPNCPLQEENKIKVQSSSGLLKHQKSSKTHQTKKLPFSDVWNRVQKQRLAKQKRNEKQRQYSLLGEKNKGMAEQQKINEESNHENSKENVREHCWQGKTDKIVPNVIPLKDNGNPTMWGCDNVQHRNTGDNPTYKKNVPGKNNELSPRSAARRERNRQRMKLKRQDPLYKLQENNAKRDRRVRKKELPRKEENKINSVADAQEIDSDSGEDQSGSPIVHSTEVTKFEFVTCGMEFIEPKLETL